MNDKHLKPKNCLRILHTSDWHLGKRLHHEARYGDFAQFLSWLQDTLSHQAVDVLVVAGDIFDTMTPSNKAQELYYQFLANAIKTPCRHIIIVAGNHDSPSFLEAPKSLLQHFCIHIVGTASGNLHDELLILNDSNGEPELIVACVPYLRDKDIRTSQFGESLSEKDQKTQLGIANHYQQLGRLCQQTQQSIYKTQQKNLPIIATGHLFATGASIASDDDGMRDLYVGSLGAIRADSFGDFFDYVALGHIHAEQMIGNNPYIRYSGSPMALGFGECHHDKYVLLIDFDIKQNKHTPAIHKLPVPKFRRLVRLSGNWHAIEKQLNQLIDETKYNNNQQAIWLDIEYHGKQIPNLTDIIADKLKNHPIIALNIKHKTTTAQSTIEYPLQHLQTLKPSDVFVQLLQTQSIISDDFDQLRHAHDTLLQQLQEHDLLVQ